MISYQSLATVSVTESNTYKFFEAISEFGGVSGLLLGWSGIMFVDWARALLIDQDYLSVRGGKGSSES